MMVKIKKFNELFNAGRVSSALLTDLKTLLFKDKIDDIKQRGLVSIYDDEKYNSNSLLDSIDWILSKFKVDKNKKINVVDIEDYIHIEIKEYGEDYGFESCFVGYKKNLKNEFQIFIKETKYINKFKKLLYRNPVILVGKLII
jgi:hypothetical protein